METTDNNILIANFMGWEYKKAENYDTTDKVFFTPHKQQVWQEADFFSQYDYEWETVSEFLPKELKFNTSWDWLIPVIEKIELLSNNSKMFGVFTLHGLGRTKVSCYKNNQLDKTIDILNENYGILPTYSAVLEFIKWYNQQKESN